MKKTVWLARDKDGDLYMYFVKPVEDYVSPSFWRSTEYVNVTNTSIDKESSCISPGSEPVECTLATAGPN